MIYDDYIQYTNEYRAKYGDKTVVLMQVGDFFELYAVKNEEESLGADIYTVGDICNIQVSRKNKAILENHRQNPLMAGFPLAIVSKHIQTLVQHSYTVVVIRQVSPPPNPRRAVTEVVSPATQWTPQGADHSYFTVLYWESLPLAYGSTQHHWAVSMVSVDITTGDLHIADAFPKADDRTFAKDEAFRWIQTFQPRELLWLCPGGAEADASANEKELEEDLQLEAMRLHRSIHTPTLQLNQSPHTTYQKLAYQTQTLEKLYPTLPRTGHTIIETLDLERHDGIRVALMYAIQFLYDHNETALKNLKPPAPLKPSEHCCVHYNALLQLNVLGQTTGERPLLSLLNRCSTAFGSRLFKERLLNPILSKTVLEHRYRAVQSLVECSELGTLKKHLGHILDLERFARRLSLAQLAPCEWVSIHQSLQHAAAVLHCLPPFFTAEDRLAPLESQLKTLQETIQSTFQLEHASRYWLHDIQGSMFQPGHYHDLDVLQAAQASTLQRLQDLAEALTVLCGGDAETALCRVESNDRYGYYLTLTKKRWDTLQKASPPPHYRWGEFKAVPISTSSSNVRLTHPTIDALSNTLVADQKRLGVLATECYRDFLMTRGPSLATHLEAVAHTLAELDVYTTNARNALDFCYACPVFSSSTESSQASQASRASQASQHSQASQKPAKSYLEAKGLRHPIIERLSQVPYVPNDVCLGKEHDGWLLYGINASGKSSLMKAIGLNLIMAQAGMFVPCERLEYEPFDAIFTRISGADNIYRGMSSFTVEMTELRNILTRCNSNSLVLGDELCAGTEALSALSIVAAGVETLAAKRATFVFATHLHELVSMQFLPSNVAVFHIHIELNEDTQKITFDRHLTPGPGHAYYGLEVCRALALPPEFLQKATQYRRKIQSEPETFVHTKPSTYNKALYVDRCALCSNRATETHHIEYQSTAKKKHVKHVPVHSTQNLIPLCEECHQKEHQGKLHIEGFKQTSTGREVRLRLQLQLAPLEG